MLKSNIVILHQYYLPHKHGALSFEIAVELAKHFCVSVITGTSIDRTNESIDDSKVNDLVVNRLPYREHGKETRLGRMRNFFSFFYATWKNRALFKEADVVIAFSTPPIIPLIPALLSRKYGFSLIFVVHDLYPDIAVKLNYTSKNSIGTWIFKTLNTFLYKRCATIVVLSKDMQELFLRTRKYNGSLAVIPNWYKNSGDKALRAKVNGPLKIIYGGSMGLPQDVESLLKAISRMGNDSNFIFQFAAYGNKRKWFFDEVATLGLKNVEQCDYMPQDIYDKFIRSSDLAIVSIDKSILGMASPSKFCSYIEKGIPVLFIGPKEMEIAQDILEYKAGVVIANGDATTFKNTLLELYKNPKVLHKMRLNARKLFEDKYSLEICADKYVDIINEVLSHDDVKGARNV